MTMWQWTSRHNTRTLNVSHSFLFTPVPFFCCNMSKCRSWGRTKASSFSSFWVSPLCFLVTHICLYVICCSRNVLSNIAYFAQSKERERVEHRASHSSGVKNVTSFAFLSQITGAIPLPPSLPLLFLPSSFCLSLFLCLALIQSFY